jgi:hypothetical protein
MFIQHPGVSNKSEYKVFGNRNYRILFYSSLFVVNLIQAWQTELFDDEAYYWVCSAFLDWGYFDHPPMIALLIRLGSYIFPSELGVRFFSIILSTLSIYLMEKLIKPEKQILFYAIILNILMLQLGGILAAPDIPLFFFTVLFFITYKNFISDAGLIQIVLLSVFIALLIYSKYHGVLIVLFTLVSNTKLFTKPAFYAVAVFSLILFAPHIIWQINNGYPSIQYQLFERVSPPFRLSFISDFVVGQLLVAGPIIGWLLIWAAFKYKADTTFEKSMLYSIIGFYVLFFISSFFTRTELNWTIPIIVPLVYLSYNYLKNDQKKSAWVYRLLPFSLIIMISIRIFMVMDISLLKYIPKDEFHQNKSWAAEIKKKANGSPVIFTNSYQRASKYWFYSGDTSFSLNTYKYRRSGYNFWPLEKQFQHKNVMLIGSEHSDNMPGYIETPRVGHAFIKIDSFQSYSQLNITSLLPLVVNNNLVNFNLKINYTSADSEWTYSKNTKIILVLYPTDKSTPVLVNTDLVIDGSRQEFRGVLKLPQLDYSNYIVRWGISNSFTEPTINSRAYKLINLNVNR